ncbi:ATP-binding protein [Pacificispira sp.]|uniref:sensor histidine kinase n=1 Tax=Pacificispira sp. TaxID=2888761 RepID=UPI003BA9E1FA
MRWSLISVRLIAAISLLGLVTCGALLAALDSFDKMRVGYDEMANRTVPELIAASRIGQTAQAIASTAPALAAVDSTFRQQSVNHRINDQLRRLDGYLDELHSFTRSRPRFDELIQRIRDSRNALEENLDALDVAVAERIAVDARMSETYATARSIVERLRATHVVLEQEAASGNPMTERLHRDWYQPMDDVLTEVLAVPTLQADALVEQAHIRASAALEEASRPEIIADFNMSRDLVLRLQSLQGEAHWLIEGERGIFGLVRAQLALLRRQEGLLNANKFLANRFVGSVADLTLMLREETLASSLSFAQAAYSKWLLLIGVMVLSIAAVISLSLYARSRIVLRLSALREALIARVSGHAVPIPVDGQDEIGDIGQAASFFAEAVAERERSLRRAKEEAERLAEQADAANRAKSIFLANMSHELRTPLNAIIGFSELIGTGHSDAERNLEYAGDINDSGRHLLELINQLLDYSKIEAGERKLAMHRVPVLHEVESLEKLIHLQLERRALALEIDIAPEIEAMADRTAFRQVILNLLTNSCKFAYERTTIRIAAAMKSGLVTISVEDKGIGISKEHLDRVLQPFHQEADSYIRPAGGTGLGLAIVESLVRMHGGQVGLSSEKGVGTTVTISFPAAEVETDAVSREAIGAAGG